MAGAGSSCRRETPPVVRTHEPAWTPLEGKWESISDGNFGEENGVLTVGFAEAMNGVKWTGEAPQPQFEMEWQARRVDGSDFFSAVTFPARGENECVTFVAGGWGGATVGISSIDDKDASENETTSRRKFERGVWYRIRLMRSGEKIEAWIDDEKVIDVSTEGKRLSLRPGPISACAPFGVATCLAMESRSSALGTRGGTSLRKHQRVNARSACRTKS